MSVATLKRKTNALYNTMSVGTKDGFSINGIYRNQGYIGQTSLSRSLPRTPMKGPTPRGHGGNYGTYVETSIVQNGVTSPESNFPGSVDAIGEQYHTKIKTSAMNTNGMLQSRYRWTRRGQPFATVKPDCNHGSNHSMDIYIANKAKNTFNIINDYNIKTDTIPTSKKYTPEQLYFISRNTRQNFKSTLLCKTTTKLVKKSMSYSEYLSHLDSECMNNDKTFLNNKHGSPIPGN